LILIDTNVWVYSAGTKHPEITKQVKALVIAGNALGHDFVFGELLLGSGSGGRKIMLDRYPDLEQAPTVDHAAISAFVTRHKLANRGIGWVDVHLLASVHVIGAQIWTEETALKKAALDLGVAFTPPGSKHGRVPGDG
jgi:predicted nucleic acid-binding protein